MELFTKLGIKEIAGIIDTMAKYKMDGTRFTKDSFELDGIKYDYLLDDNNLVVKSSDGRSMNIIINAETKEFKYNNYTNAKVLTSELNINYYMPTGDVINLYKDNIAVREEGYKGFEGIPRHEIIHGMKTFLIGKDGKAKSRFNLELNEVYLDDEYKTYNFGPDGISFDNRLVTLDGKELLVINNQKIKDLDEMVSFNGAKEKFILSRIIHSDRDLHPYTKRIIEDETFKKIDIKNKEVEDVKKFYDEDARKLRKVIAMRNEMIDNVEKYTYKEKEIEALDKSFRDNYKKDKDIKIKKYTF